MRHQALHIVHPYVTIRLLYGSPDYIVIIIGALSLTALITTVSGWFGFSL